MKKFMLLFIFQTFFFGYMMGVDQNSEKQPDQEQSISSLKDCCNFEKQISQNENFFLKKVKKLKNIFKTFKQAKKSKGDFGNLIISFFLGFLFGIIGILISFLIYRKHVDRKRIVGMAWSGWAMALAIISLIFLI